jgi:predicted porin
MGLSATAAAQGTAGSPGLSYTYAEIGYGQLDFDGNPDIDGDGLGIAGSYALTDQFHLVANYSTADLDLDVDYTDFGVGFGFNTPISDSIDVVATLSYVYREFDSPGSSSNDDSGLGGGLGLRALVNPQIEVFGGVKYDNLSDSDSDSDSDTALALGARYNFNEKFSAGLAGSWSDDVSSYTLTGRMNF